MRCPGEQEHPQLSWTTPSHIIQIHLLGYPLEACDLPRSGLTRGNMYHPDCILPDFPILLNRKIPFLWLHVIRISP